MSSPEERDAAAQRAERLAAALRENLKRRKVQAKGRVNTPPGTAPAAQPVAVATPDAAAEHTDGPENTPRVVSPGHKR